MRQVESGNRGTATCKTRKKQGARGWRGFNNGFFLDLFVCLGLVRVGLITFEEFGKSQQGEKSNCTDAVTEALLGDSRLFAQRLLF